MQFNGTPEKYKKIAIVSSILINGYLFFGLALLLYWHSEQTWMFAWKPVLIACLFTLMYARMAYRWMMRLDAQFGTGRGWKLDSVVTKLPEKVIRKK